MTTTDGKGFTGQKAVFLNMKEDGLKIRSSKIDSKKNYKRKEKHRNQRDW